MALWNLRSRNPTWLETSKFDNFPFYRLRNWVKQHIEVWSPRIQLDLVKWHSEIWSPRVWLDNSKSANFSFYIFGGKQDFEIWSPKIQPNLKLPNVPTFQAFFYRLRDWVKQHIEVWSQRIQLDLVKWHSEIWSPRVWLDNSKSANFSFYIFGGKQDFEISSPKIQLDLKLPNLLIFFFVGGWVGDKVKQTLKSQVQVSDLTWNFQMCQLFIWQGWGWGERVW